MGYFTSEETKADFMTSLWLSVKQYKMDIISTEEFLKVFRRAFDDESKIEFKERIV